MSNIHASIVLYNNKKDLLEDAVNSFLSIKLDIKLYLIDNSKTDELRYLAALDNRIEYIFNNKNIGFGPAHNIALKKSIENEVDYHLVLNPDVYFDKGVVEELVQYMNINTDVANVIPQVYYPNGDLQRLCKMLPTPIDFFVRRFIPVENILRKVNARFELHDCGYNKEMNIPSLSGCFMLLRVKHLEQIGLFDEKIFLYMEDLDLNRRLYMKYRTIFYPHVSITHVHARESHKRKTQLMLHIRSTLYYFNKWGWFFDSDRRKINKMLLKSIKN